MKNNGLETVEIDYANYELDNDEKINKIKTMIYSFAL